MAFLDRAEAAYLGILRVVVLLVATIALAAFVLGLVIGGKMFLDARATGARVPPVTAVTLGDYIADKKSGSGTADASAPDATSTNSVSSPREIAQAAQNLVVYAKRSTTPSQPLNFDKAEIIRVMLNKQQQVGEEFQAAYRTSLQGLTYQLTLSKGRPLSLEEINDLLDWHLSKFKAAAGEDANARITKGAGSLAVLSFAGASMLTFLLLVFCFIFVKIERNLRVVRTLDTGIAQ